MSYQDADFLILSVEVPKNALSHALQSTLYEAIGYNYTINEGLEASRDVHIAELKPHIPSCQVDRHEAILDAVHGFGSRSWGVVAFD